MAAADRGSGRLCHFVGSAWAPPKCLCRKTYTSLRGEIGNSGLHPHHMHRSASPPGSHDTFDGILHTPWVSRRLAASSIVVLDFAWAALMPFRPASREFPENQHWPIPHSVSGTARPFEHFASGEGIRRVAASARRCQHSRPPSDSFRRTSPEDR